jgi:hypothetical protein
LIHEPWEDEEAEVLALLMSGEICAPRDLYERVRQDLADIRGLWGDSILQLVQITFDPPYTPGYLSIGADEATHAAMRNGTYTAWDSLNDLYWINNIAVRDPLSVGLYSSARVNPRLLARVYEDLPGLRWALPGGGGTDRPNIYGYVHESGPSYLFRNAWGDCPSGCISSHFWYFQSENGKIRFQGDWFPHGDMPEPEWWAEAEKSMILFSGDDFWTSDSVAPSAIVDLSVKRVGGNSVTLGWTAPGDDGIDGIATRYEIRYSTSEITESTNLYGLPSFHSVPDPKPPGSSELWTIDELHVGTPYYFVVRVVDEVGNTSPISNVVVGIPVSPPGWTNYDTANSGLADNVINAIAVDQDGVAWIATDNGVSRFDGVEWTTYNRLNSGLADNVVRAVAADSGGSVWFATYKGASRFDGVHWTTYTDENSGLATNSVLSLTVDKDGNVWFGTVNLVVSRFDGSSWRDYPIPLEVLYYGYVLASESSSDGSVWFGTQNGVARFGDTAWAIYTRLNSGLAADMVHSVAPTEDGAVWFAHGISSRVGASRFDGSAWTNHSPGDYVYSVAADHSGRVWLSTNSGAVLYDGSSGTEYGMTNSGIVSEQVRTIHVDGTGNVWFGTDAGVSRLAAEFVESYG